MAETNAQQGKEYRSYSQFSSEERLTLVSESDSLAETGDAVLGAFRLLQVAFLLSVLLAGIDKFAGQLVDWPIYLSPALPHALGLTTPVFLHLFGAMEILLGIGLAFRPKAAAALTGIYFCLGALNYLLHGHHFNLALAAFALALSAFAMARLGRVQERNLAEA